MTVIRSGSNLLRVAGGGGIVSVPSESGAYSWATAAAGFPFATITQPTAPTTSGGSVAVTTGTIGSHINASKEMTLAAGSYGDIELTGNHQKLILSSGVSIGHLNLNGADLIAVEGSSRTATIDHVTLNNAQDISFYQVAIANSGDVQNFIRAQRASFISCSVRMGGYSFWVDPTSTDIVWGNCDIETNSGSTRPCMRILSAQRTIRHRCRIANLSNQTAIRIHAEAGDGVSDDHWSTLCQFEGSPGNFQPTSSGSGGDTSSDIRFNNNAWYPDADGGNFQGTDSASPPAVRLTMIDEDFYGVIPPNELSGWDIGTSIANRSHAFTSAPAWSYA